MDLFFTSALVIILQQYRSKTLVWINIEIISKLEKAETQERLGTGLLGLVRVPQCMFNSAFLTV